MGTQKQVVYPSIGTFNSNAQLNFGPYGPTSVVTILRAEVRGNINWQGEPLALASVLANFQMWGLQWVPHGNAALDVVSSGDDDHWLLREQVAGQDKLAAWTPVTNTAAVLWTEQVRGDWAGQLAIGASIDLYLSMRAPTGVVIPNMNFFGSIRWWWS